MIDAHCHMEQPDYQKDRDEVIKKCNQKLDAIVTCCANPNDFDLTMQMLDRFKNFVFATFSIHPIYVKEINEKQKDDFFNLIIKNKDKANGIGETGLDYHHVTEDAWRKKQKELFIEHISLAKNLGKPLVIHSRDSTEDAIKVLEQEDAKNVLMHMFGARYLLNRVKENGWYISVGPISIHSKTHKKIIRDMPIEKILLETDSPWFGPEGKRNIPTAVLDVAKRISQVKKLDVKEVDEITTRNVVKLFGLNI
jgi:TatD DNase family protein